MKKIRHCILLLLTLTTAWGCSEKYDDTELRNKMDNLKPIPDGIVIGFDRYDVFYCTPTENEITLVLPADLKESDYNAITATVSNGNNTDTDFQSRSASSENGWGVTVTKPTFNGGNLVAGSAKVTLSLPRNPTNYKALLRVSIVDKAGMESSVSRMVWFKADRDANVIDNTSGALSGKITDPAQVKQLSVVGALSDDDFKYLRENLTAMEVLDLSRSTLTALPEKAMAFYENTGLPVNTTLKTVILPETLVSIGNSAFAMCTSLQNINIPSGVTSLGRWMFEGCKQLSNVQLSEGLTDIPSSAFYGCGIGSVVIPESVTSMGDYVFQDCSKLQSADIRANVTALGAGFFWNCTRLTSVKLSSSITTIGGTAFCNTGLKEFTIPSHVREVLQGAFSENLYLETVSIPSGLQMTFSMFYFCKALKNVTIAEGVTELGAETFRDCTALEAIVLPSTITSIRDRAFQGCSALTSLTCKALTPPVLSEHNTGENYNFHFYGINSSCALKRPAGADYSAWSSSFGSGINDI